MPSEKIRMQASDLRPQQTLGVIFWFRNDLRLHDQLALQSAIEQAQQLGGWLLPIYIHDERWHAVTPWGFERTGKHRRAWVRMALDDLSTHLTALGSRLVEACGDPVRILSNLVHGLGNPMLWCEDICAPEEQQCVEALRGQGVEVHAIWQSTLMDPLALPFLPEDVPDRFTSFRQMLESQQVRAAAPLEAIRHMPPLPAPGLMANCDVLYDPVRPAADVDLPQPDRRSSFPWDPPGFHGGETSALAHLAQYCRRGLPHTYKTTRNALAGVDHSTKWSPWLATGALSARTAWAAIANFEASHGANESTYWLGFELLWRDHFRWLHRKHGRRLYAARGLSNLPPAPHNPVAFERWCSAQTGNPFIDAGMKELALTGYLSNRMRQNVASYLVHDLACDWRAGAAWFEAHLVDFDVYSNQGNWLYISGRGTDPRPHRRFNPQLQAGTYDPDGSYRALWAQA